MFRLREKIHKFMSGRYGFDEFSRFLIYVSLGVAVVNMFLSAKWGLIGRIVSFFEYAVLIYAIYRILSKNIYVRAAENRKYRQIANKVKAFFKLQKDRIRDRKTYIYRRCPGCRNVLRLPKKKGKHTVKCPCCSNRFDIRVLF